jgi:N-acetylglucosaminyldiphosphoundecaprenol N-acetyl-beta-D-mannosaminyltransferase
VPSRSCSASPAPRRVLGIRVDAASAADVLTLVAAAIAARHPVQVVTINTEMLMMAREDADLRRVVEGAALVVPDAAGLMAAGRLLGQPFPQLLAGSDLMPDLCRVAAANGWRPFFLGAAPGVAERVAARLVAANPTLAVAGAYGGSPAPADEAAVVAAVSAAAPDLLFVAYGVPAEEKWLACHLEALGVPVAMGVGGAFNFVAGVLPRAPLWMRRLGLEWLHRLYLQPWRWRRMLALPHFAALVFAQAAVARLRWRRSAPARPPQEAAPDRGRRPPQSGDSPREGGKRA